MKRIQGLYAITDRRFYRDRTLEQVAEDLLSGGVTCIQLREKDLNTRELLEAGRVLRRMTRAAGALFIVNDRVDVALALGADGVHLGQEDLPIRAAREMLGADRVIGISTHSVQEAREAEMQGADYVGVGPMRTTSTKTDTRPVVGIDGLRRIREAVSLPIVAIGGIRLEDAEELAAAGADSLAVIQGLLEVENLRGRADAFVEAISRGRRRREGEDEAAD